MIGAKSASARASVFTKETSDILDKIMKSSDVDVSPTMKVEVYRSYLKAIINGADEGFRPEMNEVQKLIMVLHDDCGADVKKESERLGALRGRLTQTIEALGKLEEQSRESGGVSSEITKMMLERVDELIEIYVEFDDFRDDVTRLARNMLPRLTQEIRSVTTKELCDLFVQDPTEMGIER